MNLKAIAAMSQNRVIGRNNALPWHIPEELQWFKKLTLGGGVLMGRKTFESIGRPLPKRKNYVLSRSKLDHEGIEHISSLDELDHKGDLWVIGGSQIYDMLLPMCNELILTHIKLHIEDGDASFPQFESYFEELEILEDNDKFCIKRYINIELKD